MEDTISRDIEDTRRHEKELAVKLKTSETSYPHFEETLGHIREACCNALLADYQAASSHNVEDRLWHSHQQINTHYRQAIAQSKKSTDRHVVGHRKLGAEYLKFIKSSQKFYRAFIGKLSAAYGNIPALQQVAKKFESQEQSRGSPRALGYPGPAELERCCHRTLIRLGDLSRYREMELVAEDDARDWATAIGYYDLALTVCPGSGQPFNQRAIISISNQNLFRATYYAYRSLTAEEPHPQAQDNLRSIMNRITRAWDKNALTTEPKTTAGAGLPRDLVATFLRLLEQYSHGVSVVDNVELEKEVITQLQSSLQDEPAEPAPVKLVLCSIAAQQAAQSKLLIHPDNYKMRNAFVSLLELNTKLFATFLTTFNDAIKQDHAGGSTEAVNSNSASGALNPIVCRVLPVIRIFSSWLSKLTDVVSSDFVRDEAKANLWTALAAALSSVTASFPTDQLPSIEHLLDEDEETIKYPPLVPSEDNNIWYADGMLRPRWHDISDNDRDTTTEMLFRVKGFLVAGLGISVELGSPLKLDAETSTFSCTFSTSGSAKSSRPRVLARPTTQKTIPPEPVAEAAQTKQMKATPLPVVPTASGNAADTEAERMVDSIVGVFEETPADVQPPLSLQTRLSPTTPARPTATVSTFGTASPFSVGSNTVADIMARTFRHGSPRDGSPSAARSGSVSRGPSQYQSPVNAPTLPRHSSHGSDQSNGNSDLQRIWETPIGEPLTRRISGQPASPLLRSGASPLSYARSHSHAGSSEFVSSIWSANGPGVNTWTSKPEAPSMSRSTSARNLQNLGNGTFGAVSPSLSDYGYHQSGTDYGWGIASLRGGLPSPTQSPWNSEPRYQKRLSGGSPLTPTNGQHSNGFGHESGTLGQSPPPRYEMYNTQAKTFRPSNLQHATAQRLT